MAEIQTLAFEYANALIEYHRAQASSMKDWQDVTYITLLDTQNALNAAARAVAREGM